MVLSGQQNIVSAMLLISLSVVAAVSLYIFVQQLTASLTMNGSSAASGLNFSVPEIQIAAYDPDRNQLTLLFSIIGGSVPPEINDVFVAVKSMSDVTLVARTADANCSSFLCTLVLNNVTLPAVGTYYVSISLSGGGWASAPMEINSVSSSSAFTDLPDVYVNVLLAGDRNYVVGITASVDANVCLSYMSAGSVDVNVVFLNDGNELNYQIITLSSGSCSVVSTTYYVLPDDHNVGVVVNPIGISDRNVSNNSDFVSVRGLYLGIEINAPATVYAPTLPTSYDYNVDLNTNIPFSDLNYRTYFADTNTTISGNVVSSNPIKIIVTVNLAGDYNVCTYVWSASFEINALSCTITSVYTLPSAPLSLSAEGGSGRIVLTWTPPSDTGNLPILKYKIYRGTSPGSEVYFAEVPGDVNTYTDTLLDSNYTWYYYKVTAVNDVGEGNASNEVNAAGYMYCDADGDGHYTGNQVYCPSGRVSFSPGDDCDDSCSTCYPGSTAYTTSPDGKDQDCDGQVDEIDAKYCTSTKVGRYAAGFDSNCNMHIVGSDYIVMPSSAGYGYGIFIPYSAPSPFPDIPSSFPTRTANGTPVYWDDVYSDPNPCVLTNGSCPSLSEWYICKVYATTSFADSFELTDPHSCYGYTWYDTGPGAQTSLSYWSIHCDYYTSCRLVVKYR